MTALSAPATAVAQPPAGIPLAAAARGGVDRAPTIELRADVISARSTTLHGGIALLWPVSPYLRAGVLAAGGVTSERVIRDGTEGGDPADTGRPTRASGRAELVVRFYPDPASAARWRPYGQASAGVLGVRGGGRGRALVSGAVGVEHSPIGSRAIRPAIEVGVGGGLRVVVALRAPLR